MEDIQNWVNQNSPSARWYHMTSDLQPPPIDKYTPRSLAVIIHRLRLGYKASWEIVDGIYRPCQHCHDVLQHPLLHYLWNVPALLVSEPPSVFRMTSHHLKVSKLLHRLPERQSVGTMTHYWCCLHLGSFSNYFILSFTIPQLIGKALSQITPYFSFHSCTLTLLPLPGV